MGVLVMMLSMSTGAVLLMLMGLFFVWMLKTVAAKLIAEDVRTMVDDLPGVLMEVALRRLPREMRDYYRPEFEDDLFAFASQHEGRPTRKLLKTTGFALSLLAGAKGIWEETRLDYEMGKQDEQNEKLAVVLANPSTQAMIGPITLQWKTRHIAFRETADGSYKLDLKTPWPGDDDVTIIDNEGEDYYTVFVQPVDEPKLRATKLCSTTWRSGPASTVQR